MNKYEVAKHLEKEIDRVNEVIDRRIIHGLSYQQEARKHKLLLVRLSHIRRGAPLGWSFERVFSLFEGLALFFYPVPECLRSTNKR